MAAEQPLHGTEFDFVAEWGRGAVGVYVVDLVRRNARALQSVAHRTERAITVLRWSCQVKCVAGHAVSDHLGVDLRSPPPCVLVLFEDDNSGALAHDETVAFSVPRTRCPWRVVVEPGRQCAGRRKAGETEAADRRLCPAAN